MAQIARICHEANRAVQMIFPSPGIPASPPWAECSDEIQDSAIDGVVGVAVLGNSPEESHENWCEFKRLHGYVWGPVKSEKHKTHPLLVPYHELDDEAKFKDHLFGAIVRACYHGESL